MDPIKKERTCLVTGVSSGIGLATAIAMAGKGIRVLGIARDPDRLMAAERLVAAAAAKAGARAPSFELCDLSNMGDVAAAARKIVTLAPELDAAAFVAGQFTTRRKLTIEGLETQFAVNHLSIFVLANLLLPALRAAGRGRVLVVSSGSHYRGRIHWKDVSLRRFYFGLEAYEQSKLANVLFVRELARREPGLDVFAVDPGLVDTGMGQKAGPSLSALVWSLRRRSGVEPDIPAQAIARLAFEDAFAGRSGLYWKDCKEQAPSAKALDAIAGRRLWSLSEALTEGAIGTTV